MIAQIQNRFPVFKEAELLQEIAEHGQIVTFPEGEVILKKDAYVKVIPLIMTGLAKVLQEGEEHDMFMYYIEPGESCLMSITACFNNEKSKIKAIIEEEAEVLVIPARCATRWYKEYASWNEFITSMYQKRFLNLLDGFNSVVYDDVDTRLKAYLKQKAATTGKNELKITHKEIAEDLGTAREVISRLLKAFESDGMVEIGRGKLTLLTI